jgi:hypothetical protein
MVQFVPDAFVRFPSSEDLRRNRLSGRLTPLQRGPIPHKYGENIVRDAVAAPAPQKFRPRTGVNFRSRNIFNGLLRVPVKKKNPALNLI